MFIHVHLPNFQCKSLSGDDLPLGLKLVFSCLSLEGFPKSKANAVFNGLLQHVLKQVFRGDTYLDLVFGCEISAPRSAGLNFQTWRIQVLVHPQDDGCNRITAKPYA